MPSTALSTETPALLTRMSMWLSAVIAGAIARPPTCHRRHRGRAATREDPGRLHKCRARCLRPHGGVDAAPSRLAAERGREPDSRRRPGNDRCLHRGTYLRTVALTMGDLISISIHLEMISDVLRLDRSASCPSPCAYALAGPVLDVLGHDPASWYAETFWLPTLGPTALLLMRHLADRFERTPEGVDLPIADTAAALGLGAREGTSSPLMRSLARLRQFELAQTENDTTISVRRTSARAPPHVRRLPTALQAEHEAWMAGRPRRTGGARPPARATHRHHAARPGRTDGHGRTRAAARPASIPH